MNDFDKYLEISQQISALYTQLQAAKDAYTLLPTPENLEKIHTTQQQINTSKSERNKIEHGLRHNIAEPAPTGAKQ